MAWTPERPSAPCPSHVYTVASGTSSGTRNGPSRTRAEGAVELFQRGGPMLGRDSGRPSRFGAWPQPSPGSFGEFEESVIH